MQARGVYQHKILPDIHGEAVVVIDYTVQPAPEGKSLISPNGGRLRQARQPAAHDGDEAGGLGGHHQGREGSAPSGELFAKTTHAAETDPAGVIEKVRQRPDVPAAELEEFRALLNAAPAATPAGQAGR